MSVLNDPDVAQQTELVQRARGSRWELKQASKLGAQLGLGDAFPPLLIILLEA